MKLWIIWNLGEENEVLCAEKHSTFHNLVSEGYEKAPN